MRYIFSFAIFFLAASYANAQLWVEDFSGEADGATSGTAGGTLGGTWSTSYSGSGIFSKEDIPVVDDGFHVSGTTSEGVWSTNTIDITSVGYAIINVDVFSAFVNGDDYIRISYVLDGVEVLFYELIGGNGDAGLSIEAPASAIVAGSSLQVIVYSRNDPFFIPFFNGQYAFDNVTITAAPIIYSRTSGSWTNAVAGTGTWSLTGHTGASCACYPLNTQVAIIGTGHTVTLPASQTTIGTPPTTNLAPGAVDVYGTLQYNTNGVTIGIQQGLFRVRSGGVVNSSSGAITGETISFQANLGGATLRVDAGGSATIEDLALAAAATNLHYLTGSGTLSITDDILLGAAAGTLTNDRSATFTISDDLDFNAASSFVNNGSMTISDDILVDADDASITNSVGASLSIGGDLSFNAINGAFSNSGTTTMTGNLTTTNNADDDNVTTNNSGGVFTLAGINPNDADMDIYNSGTINQSGDFTNISTGDTNFDNLATGVWNLTRLPNTAFDTDVATVLNLTAIGNTFAYSGAGAQRIIPTTYHHINLSNTGAKDANNVPFSVQGNWTVSGAATFTEGTGTITLNGSVAQTITNGTGETFYNLTINNSFASSPQITLGGNVTVSNILTMDNGIVNLNANTFALTGTAAGALVHGLTSADGWMYGGSFRRARPASTVITVGTAHSFFPLGSDGDWRPFFAGQNNIASTAGTMTVSHTNSTSTSIVAFAEGIVRRHNSFWTVSTGAVSGGTYTLRSGGTNFGTIGSNTHIRMSTSTGVVGTHGAGSGGPTDWRVNRTAVAFANLTNNYHVASTNAGSSPLPIELLSFSAQLKNNVVELKWSTASEINNDYFTIERTTNTEQFEDIITEDGMGTTKEINHYNVIDPSPLYGRSYYRLKQTDFDGKFSYSSVQVINYEGPEHATLIASPNPFAGSTLTIRIEGLKVAGQVPLQIVNMQGQLVFEKVIDVKTPGIVTEEISANNLLPGGLYLIKAGETLYLTQKLVVK